MKATLTSKGQLTLPKPARDALQLATGTTFSVKVMRSGSITLTPIRANPLSIAGLLKSPLNRPMTAKDMDDAISEYLAEKHERIRTTGRSSAPRDR